MNFAGLAILNTLGLNVFGASITAPLVHAVNMSIKPHLSALIFMNGLSQTTSCNRNSQYSNPKRLNNLDVGVMSVFLSSCYLANRLYFRGDSS